MNDPFSVLGLSSSASEEEIKAAYRSLAKKYHPDLHPGDKAAEEKMRTINEAYTQALQYKKTGSYGREGFGGSSGSYGGNPFGGAGGAGGYGGYGGSSGGYNRQESDPYSRYSNQNGSYYGQRGGNPFEDFTFGFDPFGFGQQQRQTTFRQRAYANPDLKTAAENILAGRFTEAIQLLNRVPTHDADWHALYARADAALGNRISAMDHARKAASMAPQDQEYQNLLSEIDSGRRQYRQTQSGRSDFQSVICGNPCLTCCAANMILNCCCGFGRYGMFC